MAFQTFSSTTRRFGSAVLSAAILFSSVAAQAAPTDVTLPTEPAGTTGTTIPTTGTTLPTTTTSTNRRFDCQAQGGQYTVVYQPESQPNKAFPWAIPGRMGGGWSPEQRCNEIASRLEKYRPDGLTEMMTAVENGYNTICVTTEKVPSCRIVLTVPQGQDPIVTRDRVFENLAIADSGQMTQGVNTLRQTNNSLFGQIGSLLKKPAPSTVRKGLSLKPFLDRADGGTGARLKGGVASTQPNAITPVSAPAKSTKFKRIFY